MCDCECVCVYVVGYIIVIIDGVYDSFHFTIKTEEDWRLCVCSHCL